MNRPHPLEKSPAARRASADDLGVLVGMLAAIALFAVAWLSFRPEPIRFAGFAVDRLSAAFALLVSGIGFVCFRYAARSLRGNPRRSRFLALLTGAVVSAAALACASNLVALAVLWASSSLFLHGLLTFCRERPESRRPAWKKFLISRIGDAALVAGVILIFRNFGTLDLREFVATASSIEDPSPLRLPVLCIVLAALTKSAQVPFHSWLPETMEAPTPVSALMHAGIINAGGVLLLRMAPAIARVPEAWVVLSAVGSLTMAVAMVSMWAQVKVKHTLAWSTVAQMGFMTVQCGLLAVPAAFLHVLGHGCCKAWSFLRSGQPGEIHRAVVTPARSLAMVLAGTIAAAPAVVAACWLTSTDLLHRPGELALAAILAMAVGQLWASLLGPRQGSWRTFCARFGFACVGGWCAVLAAFTLYRAVGWYLEAGAPAPAVPIGWAAWVAAALPVLACILLTILHAFLPALHRWSWGTALHVHALHGFYLGAVADRLVDAVTVRVPSQEQGATHA